MPRIMKSSVLTKIGMNDVLPKPFTKEGLLQMLEKHLGHLKKMPEGMEAMTPHPAPTIPQSSATQSLKDESSPVQSPSTISNWQSPGQFPGISPTVAAPPSHFMQPVQGMAPYGMDQSPLQYQPPHPPHTPLSASRQPQHRRQVSEIEGGDDVSGDSKRQRIYPQPSPLVVNQVSRGRPG